MKRSRDTQPVREVNLKPKTDQKKNSVFKIRNAVPKILCILAAFILWIYVMQTESPEYEETVSYVQVELENTEILERESGLSVYSGYGSQINVTVSGKKSVVNKLTADDISASADVGKITEPGRHSVDVAVELPKGVTLVEPSPATVTVYADETDTVSLQVKEKLDKLMLPDSYKLGKLEFEYDSITVSGPKNKIKSLSEAQVTIDMENKTSSFSTKCPIVLVDSSGNTVNMDYLKCSVTEINVRVPVYTTKEIKIPVEFKYGLFDEKLINVNVEPSTVFVTGDITDISAENVISPIIIDEKEIKSNTYTMTVTPEVLPNVTLESGKKEVVVTVELDASLRTKQFNVTDIQVTGADKSLSYEILDDEIDVTLRGPLSKLTDIKASDLYLLVDLNGYDKNSSGTVTRPASVVIDAADAAGVFEVGEYNVQVKINR